MCSNSAYICSQIDHMQMSENSIQKVNQTLCFWCFNFTVLWRNTCLSTVILGNQLNVTSIVWADQFAWKMHWVLGEKYLTSPSSYWKVFPAWQKLTEWSKKCPSWYFQIKITNIFTCILQEAVLICISKVLEYTNRQVCTLHPVTFLDTFPSALQMPFVLI